MADKFLQPRWAVIGTYRTCPLPMKPIPPYIKPRVVPAYLYLSKQPSIKLHRDAVTDTVTDNVNSPPDGRSR